jgi:hypothetical protein
VTQNENFAFAEFIGLQRALDSANSYLLEYRLVNNRVDGNFHHAVKSLYKSTHAYVHLDNGYIDWFNHITGVRQGDNLSTTLFAIYINDIAFQIKALNKEVHIDHYSLSIPIYADDIALISPTERGLTRYAEHW